MAEEDMSETTRKTYALRLGATVSVPASATELLARDGTVVGFQLEDGSLVKPWITWEHQKTDSDDDGKDLNHEELVALGFDYEYEERVLDDETSLAGQISSSKDAPSCITCG